MAISRGWKPRPRIGRRWFAYQQSKVGAAGHHTAYSSMNNAEQRVTGDLRRYCESPRRWIIHIGARDEAPRFFSAGR